MQRPALRRFSAPFVSIPMQSPQRGETARHLDSRIEAEAHQCDAAGEKSGDERDDALGRIPGDGQRLQPPAAPSGPVAIRNGFTNEAGAILDHNFQSARNRLPRTGRLAAQEEAAVGDNLVSRLETRHHLHEIPSRHSELHGAFRELAFFALD